MRALRLSFAVAALAVASCGPLAAISAVASAIPSAPVQVCDRTQWDENGGQLVELGYKAWRLSVKLGVQTGFVHGALATQTAKLDNQLFAATQAVQTAYSACNAASYKAAIAKAKDLLAHANAAMGAN